MGAGEKTEKNRSHQARIDELQAEIRDFEDMAATAGTKNALTAAVNAKKQASNLRRTLDQYRAEMEATAVKSPLRRAEMLRQRAAADGSWIAAAQLGKLVEEERVKAAAAAAAEKDAAKRDPGWALKATVASLKRMPEAMQERWLGALLEAALPAARRRAIMPFALGAAVDEARERKQQA